MPLFDAYLMVDWSASSVPKTGRDSIWAAWGRAGELSPPRTANLATRRRARHLAEALLSDAVERKLRVLVGFDFAYGYPQGFARCLKIDEREAWRSVWSEITGAIHDDLDGIPNKNDRFKAAADLNQRIGATSFVGPFWACPSEPEGGYLRFNRPDFQTVSEALGLREYRKTELRLREEGRPTIQSAWKLFTSGSVGGQALLGIPVVHALVEKFRNLSRVWPFETGFTATPSPDRGPYFLHAEIWPGVLESPSSTLNDSGFSCRDEAQVSTLVDVLRGLDAENRLGALFAPGAVVDLSDPALCREEGWILGAGIDASLRGEILERANRSIAGYSPLPPTW